MICADDNLCHATTPLCLIMSNQRSDLPTHNTLEPNSNTGVNQDPPGCDVDLLNYSALKPETILNAIEAQGWRCDGRLQALNSFENRVYLVGIEDGPEIVAKFYRPNRWTDEAILEEHHYSQELYASEIPVVPPIEVDGNTLFNHQDTSPSDASLDVENSAENNRESNTENSPVANYRFSLFDKRGGRAPDLEDFDTLEQMGRFLGRIHKLGESQDFVHRPELTLETYGIASREYLLANNFIPPDLVEAYASLSEELLTAVQHSYERAGDIKLVRTHSDCHPGNILWTPDGPHIVDFDDARMTPACQDLWMFLSGDRADMTAGLDALLEGYSQFCDFNARELQLIEALRTLRLMHYYAWLAKRWNDPAFKIAFPWFNTQQCWEQHVLNLREQAAAMYEEPLVWFGA